MKKPTPKQVRHYVKEDPNCCPLCGNAGIEGGPVNIDDRWAYQNMWCEQCAFEWVNGYKLTAIYESDQGWRYSMEDECPAENS